MKKIATAAFLAGLALPLSAAAFSLEWHGEPAVTVQDPQRAIGYAGKLTGEPHEYTFTLAEPAEIYFTVLVPDTERAKTDISAALVDTRSPDVPVGVILGTEGIWKSYDYQGDAYLKTQEFRATIPAGAYQLIIWSSQNDSPYVLVLGEREPNILAKIAGTLSALPTVRTVFFGRSAASVIFAPIILVPVLVVVIAIVAALWLVRGRTRVL